MANHQPVICEECRWVGRADEMLETTHPFLSDETVAACPNCKSLCNTVVYRCDEPGCKEPSVMGWPSKNGYRMTCHEHRHRER